MENPCRRFLRYAKFLSKTIRGTRVANPSPLGRGDRSGASIGEVRAKAREAVAVGEIHPATAPSPKRTNPLA